MGVRNSQCRNLHTGGVQLLCLFFRRASIIGEELQSLCIFLFEEFKAGNMHYLAQLAVELHSFISDQSVCLPFLIQCERNLPSQSYYTTKEIKPNNNTNALCSLHLQSLSDLVANCNGHSPFVFACVSSTALEKPEFLYCSER